MNRRVAALALLALLAASAGCASLFPGDVNRERLDEEVTYDWETDADVTITVGKDRYRAVYRIENRSTFELYRFERFNNKRPLDPIGLRFRYPNGTVVGSEAMAFEKSRSRLTIELPASNGTLAYSAPKQGKELRAAILVEDASYEVILPENARVRYPLLGRVLPRGYEASTVDGRVHIEWDAEAMRGDRVVVRYYLVRDLYLFGGLFAVGIAAAVGVVAYFWVQLRAARKRRQEVGLDVEE